MSILAFDIGGTQGRCCVASNSAENTLPVLSNTFGLHRTAGEDGAAWLKRLLQMGRDSLAQNAVDAVTISFGGPVTPDGRVLSMHVPGWERIDLRGEMSGAFGVPVCVENDANSGAWGEFRYGAGRGCNYMAYFTVSTGIGGGVVLGGKLYTGARGMAGEFGHMTMVDPEGAPQYLAGKPGVLEALACGPAVARDGKAELKRRGQSVPENLTGKDVYDAAGREEGWAVNVRDMALGHLARGIAAVACAFDIERVIIGGGVSLAGDALLLPLREKVNRVLPPFLEGKVEVLRAELGDNSPLMGAIALGFEYLSKRS